MPDLAQSLSKYDFGFLRIIAQFWDFDIQLQDKKETAQELALLMLQPAAAQKFVQALPEEAIAPLKELLSQAGRIPYSIFSRKYGEIRQVGIAKRDREALYLSPISVLEFLWYRGLIFLDFFEHQGKIEEMVYIPTDLLKVLPLAPTTKKLRFSDYALPEDYRHKYSVGDRILDDACTCLAWLRKNTAETFSSLEPFTVVGTHRPPLLPANLAIQFLLELFLSSNLIQTDYTPVVNQIKEFLSESSASALNRLALGWLSSSRINELKSLPEIICLGDWNNDPIATRQFLLQQIQTINVHKWINLESFIHYIKQTNPDFQRPSGNYDVWIIRHRSSDEILRGFESWEYVEGRLLRYLILGPLFWLGLVDLGADEQNTSVRAFKPTSWFDDLLSGKVPLDRSTSEHQKIILQSNGKCFVSLGFPRDVRYHLARSCEWEKFDIKNERYTYCITAKSLSEAYRQGLKPQQLVSILRKYATSFPPNLLKAIARWEDRGREIELKVLTVLSVTSPEIVTEIKKSRLAKHIQQTLNPTTIAIYPGSEEVIVKGLLEMGYLVELTKNPKRNPGKSATPSSDDAGFDESP